MSHLSPLTKAMKEGQEYNSMDSPPTENPREPSSHAFSEESDSGIDNIPMAEMSSPDKFETTNFNLNEDLDEQDNNLSGTTSYHNVEVSRSTYIFVLCAALNSCNLGYDIGVNTSAGKLLLDENSLNLNERELEVFMGSLNLFAAVGAIFASSISDKFGRKGAFLVAATGFILGILIQSLAGSYSSLMVGRLFVGLGVGFGLAIDPIYISEVSPSQHRGRLVTWSEIATNVGIVFGFSSGLIFYDVEPDIAWRLMFGCGIILPSFLIYSVIKIMPESPRWLISKGREDEAKLVLEKIYPIGCDINAVVKEIKNAIKREMDAEQAVGWDMIFFPTPAFRRMLVVGVGSAIAQQLVGIDAIQYFLDFILEEAGVQEGIKRTFILIGLGILKLSFIFYAGRAFDKHGRRPLLFLSLFGISISLFIVAAKFGFENLNSMVGIIGLAFYLSFFSLGMGPGAWLIPAEVFSTVIRAKAMSVATFMNRVTGTLVTSTFFTLANLLTYSGFFILLGLVNLGISIFFYIFLPETKGRSLEEMSLYFAEITGDESVLEAERRLQEQSSSQDNNTNTTNLPTGTLA